MRVLQKPGIHLGLQFIVPIHKPDPIPGGLRHPTQAGSGDPGVFLVDYLHPAVPQGKVPGNGETVIPGTVVHQNHFQIPVGLGKDALHTAPQPRGKVVHRYNYGNLILGHFSFPSLSARQKTAGYACFPGTTQVSGMRSS